MLLLGPSSGFRDGDWLFLRRDGVKIGFFKRDGVILKAWCDREIGQI